MSTLVDMLRSQPGTVESRGLALVLFLVGDIHIMPYRERLNYWAIARLLPTQNWRIVARFHRRSDAEGHCEFLKRSHPDVQFKVVFEISEETM